MAGIKKSGKEEMVRDVFMALLSKWDVRDRGSARNLAKHAVEIADGFYEEMDHVFAAKKPEKPA
jgi:hypothetical protein